MATQWGRWKAKGDRGPGSRAIEQRVAHGAERAKHQPAGGGQGGAGEGQWV
ncbi:MAG: hypothetical protein ACKOGA_10385 [Planctomycetaceae bacterium]